MSLSAFVLFFQIVSGTNSVSVCETIPRAIVENILPSKLDLRKYDEALAEDLTKGLDSLAEEGIKASPEKYLAYLSELIPELKDRIDEVVKERRWIRLPVGMNWRMNLCSEEMMAVRFVEVARMVLNKTEDVKHPLLQSINPFAYVHSKVVIESKLNEYRVRIREELKARGIKVKLPKIPLGAIYKTERALIWGYHWGMLGLTAGLTVSGAIEVTTLNEATRKLEQANVEMAQKNQSQSDSIDQLEKK